MENSTTLTATATPVVITPEALYNHWQGHRGLTRRVIEAFPEEQLFKFSIGGMRPFAHLAMELIDLAGSGVKGFVTGEWVSINDMDHHTGNLPRSKNDLLKLWDETTATMETYWPRLSGQSFQEVVVAFGMYEAPVYGSLLYLIDNEIHHRGQGYVYLRALGIEPPPFWDRQ